MNGGVQYEGGDATVPKAEDGAESNQVSAPAATQELDTLILPNPPEGEAQQHLAAPMAAAVEAPGVTTTAPETPAPVPAAGQTVLEEAAAAPPKVEADSTPAPAEATETAAPAAAAPATPGATTDETMADAEGKPDAAEPSYAYATAADTEEYKRSYALTLSVRKKPKCIFAMAMGMHEFNGILDRPPLSALKRKELTDLYVPKADDFKYEIKRRAHFFMNVPEESAYFTEDLKRQHPLKTKRSNIVLPQPNQWLNSNLKNWLLERPMRPNESDVNFVRTEVHKALEYLNKENNSEGGGITPVRPTIPETPVTLVMTSPMSHAIDVLVSPAPSTMATLSVEEIPTEPYNYTSPADSDEFKRSASMNYLQRDSKARILLAMALGMPEFQGLLDHPPFTIIKRKDLTDEYVPRAEDYRFEIKRRAHFFMNVAEESAYYTRDMKRKNPLENMRGIVALPQPNQWKLQALKGWLSERPLRPNQQDSAFLRLAIQNHVDALNELIQKDSQVTETPGKRVSRVKNEWNSSDANSYGSNDGPGGSKRREGLLLECITKQDSILGAVTKQTQQQTILNKITVLTQAISGYQQEISSLRTVLNDTENRILKVEMRIAEAPESESRLSSIITKQQDSKNETELKIKELQQLILESRKKIENHSNELDQVEEPEPEEETPSKSRKRKFGADEEVEAEKEEPEAMETEVTDRATV